MKTKTILAALAIVVLISIVSAQSPSTCCTDREVLRKGVEAAYDTLVEGDVAEAKKILLQTYALTERNKNE